MTDKVKSTKFGVRSFLVNMARMLLGLVFMFSGVVKAIDPVGTQIKFEDYIVGMGLGVPMQSTWLLVMACLLAGFEILLGAYLVMGTYRRGTSFLIFLLMCILTPFTLYLAIANPVHDCGCFGDALKLTNWQTFYKNLVIDSILLALIFNNKQLKNRLTWRGQFVIGCIYALIFVLFEIYNYRHLPVVDFMNWKVGKQMKVENEEPAKIYLTFRNINTGETQEYLSPDYPWNDSVWSSQWEFVDQRMEGGNDYLGFSALDADGNDVTDMILETENLLMFTSHDLTKVTDEEWQKIKTITEEADAHGYYVVWAVANSPEYVEELQETYDFLYEVYFGDELEIKTLVRFNPGLMLLDDGLVVDKWSAIDFDKALKKIQE